MSTLQKGEPARITDATVLKKYRQFGILKQKVKGVRVTVVQEADGNGNIWVRFSNKNGSNTSKIHHSKLIRVEYGVAEPIFGVVVVPAQEVTYYGYGKTNSFKLYKKDGNEVCDPIRVKTFSKNDADLTIVASKSFSNPKKQGSPTNKFISNYTSVTIGEKNLKQMGSSLKFLLVAEGGAH